MTESPQLYFDDDGTPRSGLFGDIYYSPQDGLAESKAVFLQGCNLPEAWRGRDHFTVLELGFGTGLNIAALMQAWVSSGAGGCLHVFTVEAFVMARDQAARALANWPEIAEYAQALTEQWPWARKGFHHMDFPRWRVSVTVALMEVEEALDAWEGRADAVFLDGFSPALNPGMWSEEVLAKVVARCRSGARLATFTVAGFVRRGLQKAGAEVQKRAGFGRKRERLEASLPTKSEVEAPKRARLALIGGGVAGAAVAWQARAMGLDVTLFDPAPGSGASGNAAALVTPRLDAGDNAVSALFADAWSYARDLYRRVCPEAILGEGVRQLAGDERERARFGKVAGQAGFAEDDVVVSEDGLRLAGLVVEPEALTRALIGDTPVVREAVGELEGFDAVVLACGDGVFDMAWGERLRLRPVRGQVEVAEGGGLEQATAWGGYAVPFGGRLLFGATHDRDDRGCDVRDESRAANLARLAEALPEVAENVASSAMASRASVRVTTRDHLPAVGEVAPGVYVLTGLGARGFCLAPLLAKALVAELVGAGAPLPVGSRKIVTACRLIAP